MLKYLLIPIVLLAGCNPPSPFQTPINKGRMTQVSHQGFTDLRGYHRDVLILRDTKTGKEYLAVMGAGVTDIHFEQQGKYQVEVED